MENMTDLSLLGGGILGGGLLVSFWGQIKEYLRAIVSLFWITIDVNEDRNSAAALAIMYYLQYSGKFKGSRFNMPAYHSMTLFVRPKNKKQAIAYSDVGDKSLVFWQGWRPLWAKFDNNDSYGFKLSYPRFFFDAEVIIQEALDLYNDLKVSTKGRFRIEYVVGVGKGDLVKFNPLAGGKKKKEPSEADYGHTNADYFRFKRILKWTPDDLGPKKSSPQQYIIWSPEVKHAVEEALFWKKSEDWYMQKLIPWKMAWMVHGKPGTGKTSLARTLAEQMDIPVYVYDLASLSNDEMRKAWSDMLQQMPCMALFEDIDAVFEGRKNILATKDRDSLTFDCLLNCLDGIEQCNGLFIYVTTNNLEKIDSALASKGTATRPGRVDKVIEITCPNREGMLELCARMLPDYKDSWEELISAGLAANETMDQFTQRCRKLALTKHWHKN